MALPLLVEAQSQAAPDGLLLFPLGAHFAEDTGNGSFISCSTACDAKSP